MHFNVAAEPVTTTEVVEALVVEDAEDEEARIAAERARGEGVDVRRAARADDGRARAASRSSSRSTSRASTSSTPRRDSESARARRTR